jgi:hypothetical protein
MALELILTRKMAAASSTRSGVGYSALLDGDLGIALYNRKSAAASPC